MPKKLGRPQITVAGVSVPGLPTHTLISIQDSMSAEILHWREQQGQHDSALSAKQGEIEKLEATVRNQDLELRRLRAKVSELESGPADGSRTRISS